MKDHPISEQSGASPVENRSAENRSAENRSSGSQTMTIRSARSRSLRITQTAAFLALTLTLSYLENLLPALPFLPPGVKLGLANIPVMFCLLEDGTPSALLLTVLKALFVLMTKGTISGALTLLGSLSSVLIMLLLSRFTRPRFSYLALSMVGAVFHNLGQLLGASFLVSHQLIWYLPVLIVSGVIMGILTGSILKAVYPFLSRLPRKDPASVQKPSDKEKQK